MKTRRCAWRDGTLASSPAGPAASSLPDGMLAQVSLLPTAAKGFGVRRRDAAEPAGEDASVPAAVKGEPLHL